MWVTFGATAGARIYVNGLLWSTAPAVTYTASSFAAPYVRFFFGDLLNNPPQTITVHDIQLYDRELSSGDIAALTRGISFTC